MSVLASHHAGNGLMDRLFDPKHALFQALAVVIVGAALAFLFDWANVWPTEWVVPIKVWISDLFRWLDKEATLGLFTVKQFTRTISWALKQPLLWSEYLLWKGAKPHQLLPIMWIAIATIGGIIAYNLRGPKIAMLVVAGIIGIVVVDSLPVIFGSIAKALRVQPLMAPEAIIGISQWPADLLKATMSASQGSGTFPG